MENKSPYAAASKYGLILGLALIIYGMLLNVLGLTGNQALGWVSFAILLGGIIWGTIDYRDKALDGFISYSGALGIGVLIIVFASIISSVYTYVYAEYIDPSLIEKMVSEAEKGMYKNGMSDEEVEQAMSMTSAFMTPAFIAGSSFLGNIFIGFLLSLVTSAILKRNPEEEE